MNTTPRALVLPLLRALQATSNNVSVARLSSKAYETLAVSVPKPFVYHVELNRPDKRNAMNTALWREIGQCFTEIHADPDCRVVVLSGAGKIFSAGMDYNDAMNFFAPMFEEGDVGRKAKLVKQALKRYQDSMSSLETGNKPVIAAINSACIGAATSIVVGADIRYCTKDSYFEFKEVIVGLAPDVGSLQRLPKIMGPDSLCRELLYTGRRMDSEEAYQSGFVSKVFDDKESLIKGALQLAEDIATKSPVAVQGTKHNLIYSRDHTVQEGLDHIALWNQTMMQSEDFIDAVTALATKQTDLTFAKL